MSEPGFPGTSPKNIFKKNFSMKIFEPGFPGTSHNQSQVTK